jgi:cytochrome c-type biogenesis protein CcsB
MGSQQMLGIENVLFTIAMLLYFASMVTYFAFIAAKKDGIAKAAFLIQIAGFVLHTAALICRGIGAGRLPLTNQYEFATSFAWGICLVCLVFVRKYHFQVLGAFSAPVIFLIIGYAAMQSKEVKELMPALRSNWLGFHVSTAIIAYGAFGVSFVLSIIFLLRDKMQDQSFMGRHVPGKEKLDMISYRSVSLGLLFLTFTILTGAIWAERAWGSYWSWDPKETWSLVTWIVYAVYLHLRLRRGWKGKSAAIFAVIGFICVMFTYVGVNNLLPGMHSYG